MDCPHDCGWLNLIPLVGPLVASTYRNTVAFPTIGAMLVASYVAQSMRLTGIFLGLVLRRPVGGHRVDRAARWLVAPLVGEAVGASVRVGHF